MSNFYLNSLLTPTENFTALLQERFPQETRFSANVFSFQFGRKYNKIIRDNSVFAFVDNETQELIKAASWNKPAFNKDKETAKKYFLDTPENIEIALFNADQYGGFLYSNYAVRIPANL